MNTLLELGIVALTIYLTVTTLRFVQVAQRTRGELVAYSSARDSEGDWLHRPVFRFTDAAGHVVVASNPRHVWMFRRLAIGQGCDLLYNPRNPAQIYRATWLDVWGLPVVLWVASLLSLL